MMTPREKTSPLVITPHYQNSPQKKQCALIIKNSTLGTLKHCYQVETRKQCTLFVTPQHQNLSQRGQCALIIKNSTLYTLKHCYQVKTSNFIGSWVFAIGFFWVIKGL